MKIFDIITANFEPAKLHISPGTIAITLTAKINELLKIPTSFCFAVTGPGASSSKLSLLDLNQFPRDNSSSNAIAIHYLNPNETGKNPSYKSYVFTPDLTTRAACLADIQEVIRGPSPPESILVLINPFSGLFLLSLT
jgi:hypothetical protein